MANIYDSYIKCISNPDFFLFLDPQQIIHQTPSTFLQRNFDELVYETKWSTMHEDIATFSKKFPNQVFMARYSDPESYIPIPKECYRYWNGQNTFLGFEPAYKFPDDIHIYNAMGRDNYFKLWFRVREYLFRLDHTKESLVDGKKYYVDMLEDHFDSCVSSTITVHAEVDNYKLSVDKITNAELNFRGFSRGSKNKEWVEILPDSKGQVPEI
jgi:hypothetical protein